jgi:hypothetical protein
MEVTLGSPQDGKNINGVCEWRAEGNIWGYEGGINKMVEYTSELLLFTKQYQKDQIMNGEISRACST